MPFHVEISSPVNRARVLNLDEADLGTQVLEPWVAGLPFEFGGGEWSPPESRLTVLEGPALEYTEDEEGWESAQRAAADVTRPLLEAAEATAPARTAAVVEAESVAEAVEELRAGRNPQPLPWSSAVERVSRRDSEVTAMILVVKRPAWSPPKL
jgi:hypothetical protein